MAKLLDGTRIYGSANVDSILSITGNYAATSAYNGTLRVAGGAGITGNTIVGQNLTVYNDINFIGNLYRNGVLYQTYTLPFADSTTLGGIKVGSGLSIGSNGVLSVTSSGSPANLVSNNTYTVINGDPAIPLFKPSAVDFSGWINRGTASVTDGLTGAVFSFPAETGSNAICAATRPFGSNTVWEVYFDPDQNSTYNNSSTGIMLQESSTGYMFSFGYMNNGGNLNLIQRGWHSATNNWEGSVVINGTTVKKWLRIRLFSGNLYAESSFSGEQGTWTTDYVSTITNFFSSGPDICGIYGDFNGGTTATPVVKSAIAYTSSRPTVSNKVPGVVGWVNFNANTGLVGANCTIRDSYNVGYVHKNANGDFTINFTTPLQSNSYAISTIASDNYYGNTQIGLYDASMGGTDPSNTSFRIISNSKSNPNTVTIVVTSSQAMIGYPSLGGGGAVNQIVGGNNITITNDGIGVVTVSTNTITALATANTPGLVKVGTGLEIDANGTIFLPNYVKKLTAGPNIVLTPGAGLGNVTIQATANFVTVPATTSVIGGVIVGYGLDVDPYGVISINTTAAIDGWARDVANNASANTIALQDQVSSNLIYIQRLNDSQNVSLTNYSTYVSGTLLPIQQNFTQSAYDKANTATSVSGFLANAVILSDSTGHLSNTGALMYYQSNNTLQVPTISVYGAGIYFPDGTLQMTSASGAAVDAFARVTANSAQANTVWMQGNDYIQNTKIIGIQAGLDAANSRISTLENSTYSINVLLGTAEADISALYTDVNYLAAVNTYQNTVINLFGTQNQAAFDAANGAANIDYTTISLTPGTYGNSRIIPIITVEANGRISSVTNTTIAVTGTGNANTNGWLNNSIIFANSTGYLSNTTNVMYIAANNVLLVNAISVESTHGAVYTDHLRYANGQPWIFGTTGGGGGTVGVGNANTFGWGANTVIIADRGGNLSNTPNLTFVEANNSTLYSTNMLATKGLHLGNNSTVSAFYMEYVPSANAVDFIFG